MALNKNRLKIALSKIERDEQGYFYSGKFSELWGFTSINSNRIGKIYKLNNHLTSLHRGIWNLETIALKLEWERELFTKNELDKSSWMLFAKCDIDLFHVQYRLVFDHLARAIAIASDSPGQIKIRSFKRLKNWVTTHKNAAKNAEKLGTDLTQLIKSCEFFDDPKEIRETIIHRDGFALVFPEKDRILFQVYEGLNKKILISEIMFNENVVDFELYAGLYIGYLIAYLEEISEIIRKILNTREDFGVSKSYHQGVGVSKSYHPGLRVIQSWIEECYKR